MASLLDFPCRLSLFHLVLVLDPSVGWTGSKKILVTKGTWLDQLKSKVERSKKPLTTAQQNAGTGEQLQNRHFGSADNTVMVLFSMLLSIERFFFAFTTGIGSVSC